MSRVSFNIILTVVVIAGVLFLLMGKNQQNEDNGQLSGYFEERLITLGIEDIGMPIEGFDANLLMAAFPGIMPKDFSGVATPEGVYVFEDGKIRFQRTNNEMITSAERTLDRSGYAALLKNISKRLGFVVNSTAQIDALIDVLNTAENIEMRIDQGASAFGIKIIPRSVLEDSRCPINVSCIQAGRVRVSASVEDVFGTSTIELESNKYLSTDGLVITLERVAPEKKRGLRLSQMNIFFILS